MVALEQLRERKICNLECSLQRPGSPNGDCPILMTRHRVPLHEELTCPTVTASPNADFKLQIANRTRDPGFDGEDTPGRIPSHCHDSSHLEFIRVHPHPSAKVRGLVTTGKPAARPTDYR